MDHLPGTVATIPRGPGPDQEQMGANQCGKTVMKPKASSRLAPFFPDLEPLNDLLRTRPRTTEDRLLHIAALGRRIQQYIRFMGAIRNMAGSSVEAKNLAVVVFHDCLANLEPQLGDIPKKMGCSPTNGERA